MNPLEHPTADSPSNTSEGSTAETETPPSRIDLSENDDSNPYLFPDGDIEFIEALNPPVIEIEHTAGRAARLTTSGYAGVLTLPSGTTVEVSPKGTVSRPFDLLRYALSASAESIEEPTQLSSAQTFIDAFGALFHAELRAVLNAGIHRDYQTVAGREDAIRGRLQVHKQLQQPEPIPTKFHVEYDTFTADIPLNQAILQAGQTLATLVTDETIAGNLTMETRRLEQFVTPRRIQPAKLKAIELTRLNDQYSDLLELTRMVLTRQFFEDLSSGDHQTFGLFIDMKTIFEAVVERAVRDATARMSNGELSVDGQGDIGAIITGDHAVDMTPDFVVNGSEGTLVVGDAKWKTDSRSSGDVYQLTSYILAEQRPGVVIYPDRDIEKEESIVHMQEQEFDLVSLDLPTANAATSYERYTNRLIEAVRVQLLDLIEQNRV